MKTPPRLSVIIPVYNERATIEQILELVSRVEIEKEIIIVDDGSTDGSQDFLCDLVEQGIKNNGLILPTTGFWLNAENIRVIFQQENRGKGAALRRGFSQSSGRIVLVQDADLELDPRDYFKLVEPIEQGRTDVVYGARFLNGRQTGEGVCHYLGNRLLTMLSNLFSGLALNDVWTCYKAVRREALLPLDLKEDGFSFEPEITAKLARDGCRICEVPISYVPRTRNAGKKIRFRDGLKGIWATVRHNLFPAQNKDVKSILLFPNRPR